MKRAQAPTDEFETLCYVKADISSAPHTTNYSGGYRREIDVILLVGLTELKAQVCWIDSRTVRVHSVPRVSIFLTRLPCVNIEDGEKVCNAVFRISSFHAKPIF